MWGRNGSRASRRAFPGGSSAQVLDAILKRTPIPASQLNPELPSQFEEIIDKALEKDRELRYQSAADLVRDLNGVRAGTTRQGGPLRSARPASRRIRGAAIGAVVGSLLIAGLLAVKLVLTGPGKYPASKTIRVGGTVSSLAGTGLVLQENGDNNLAVSAEWSVYLYHGAGQWHGLSRHSVPAIRPPSPAALRMERARLRRRGQHRCSEL